MKRGAIELFWDACGLALVALAGLLLIGLARGEEGKDKAAALLRLNGANRERTTHSQPSKTDCPWCAEGSSCQDRLEKARMRASMEKKPLLVWVGECEPTIKKALARETIQVEVNSYKNYQGRYLVFPLQPGQGDYYWKAGSINLDRVRQVMKQPNPAPAPPADKQSYLQPAYYQPIFVPAWQPSIMRAAANC